MQALSMSVAVPFVPGMESCTVLERQADGLLREGVLRGDAEAMKSSYLSAIATTLRTVRRFVQEGQL